MVYKILIPAMLATLANSPALALDTSDFGFVAGESTSNYSLKGKPNSTVSYPHTHPGTTAGQVPDVLSDMYSMLPEGTPVNPNYISDDTLTNISIDKDSVVTVTFLNEGAGYRNMLGYFIYDTGDAPITTDEIAALSPQIIFPNASLPPIGEMIEGDTIDLGVTVSAGKTISFFVIPNGWGWVGSYNNILNLGPWDTPFYSLSQLNPEVTDKSHNVAFVDSENEFMVIGFEDVYRPASDNDFNDIIFIVNVGPFSGIVGVDDNGDPDGFLQPLIQSGTPDSSVTTMYPSSTTWSTIAFEDRWPVKGDYDFNDVVMNMRFAIVQDENLDIKSISGRYKLQAMGGDYHNGFALKLPGVDPTNIASTSLTMNGITVDHDVLETSSTETVLIVSPDIRKDLTDLGYIDATCRFYKTQSACLATQTQTVEYRLDIKFTTPVDASVLGDAPYDHFIFASEGHYHGDFAATPPGRTWETHLKEFGGTDYFDNSLLNTYEDSSSGSNTFVTSNDFPWTILLSDTWIHPLEREDISDAYPDFPSWVENSGTTHLDWYTVEKADPTKIAQ